MEPGAVARTPHAFIFRGLSLSKRAASRRFVPRLRHLESRRLLAIGITSITQAASYIAYTDFVGNGPSVGPDNIPDIDVKVSGINLAGLDHVEVSANGTTGTINWASGINPSGWANAEVVGQADGTTHIYVNPIVANRDPRVSSNNMVATNATFTVSAF